MIQKIPTDLSTKMANMAIASSFLIVLHHAVGDDVLATDTGLLRWLHVFFKSGFCICAMPWFFFAAGFFLLNRYESPDWYKNLLIRKVRSLLIPWQVVTIISLGVACLLALAGVSHYEWPFSGVWDCINKAIGITHQLPYLHHFWFVRNLIVLVAISPCIIWMLKRFPRTLIVILFLLGWCSPFLEKIFCTPPLFFYSWVSLDGLPFFVSGIAVRYYGLNFKFSFGWGTILAIIVSLALCVGLNFFGFYWCQYPLKVFGTLAIWGLISDKQTWNVLRGCSYPVYAFHILCLSLWHGAYKRIFGEAGSAVEMFITTPFIIAIIVLVSQLLRKTIPRFASVLFGGR